MLKRKIILVLKHEFSTRCVQNLDLFESFKFVGMIASAIQEESHFHLSAKELLERIKANEDEKVEYRIVGVIIPDNHGYFLPTCKVYSDGQKWAFVEDVCRFYNAVMQNA